VADAQRTIDIIFNGVDKTALATQSAVNGVSSFSSSVQSATQPVADFTTSAVKLEAGILAVGVAMTAASIVAAGGFDTAFREISTLIDAPVEDLDRFKQSLLDYAGTSTQSLETITAATYNAISAGVDYTDSIDALRVAEQLAVGGRADLNDSMVVLVSSLNAYGLGMEHAAEFSDILFTTVEKGQTTLPELSAALSNVTGTAATLEIPFSDLNASIAALTSVGIPTGQAVTAINAALTAMIAPSSEARTIAAELGLEFSAQAVKANGLQSVLNSVAEATGGSEEQMRRLFGSTEAMKAVLQLTGNASEKFAETLDAMAGSSGATDAAFKKMAGSFDLSIQKIVNGFTLLSISIGDPLLDEFGGIAEAIRAIFLAIGKEVQDGALTDFIKYIESQMEGLEKTLATIAKNIPAAFDQADLSGFIRGLESIGDAFGKIFDGADLTTANGLAQAITLIGNSFAGLSAFTGGVIESFETMVDTFGDLATDASELGDEVFKTAGLVGGFAEQANILSTGLNNLMPTIETLLQFLVIKQGAGLVGGLGAVASKLTGSTGLIALLGKGGLVAAAGAAGYALGTVLKNGIDDALSALTGRDTSLGSEIYDLVEQITDPSKIEENVDTTTDVLLPLIRILTTGLPGAFGEAGAATGDWLAGLLQGNDAINDTEQKIGDLKDAVSDFGVTVKKVADEESAKKLAEGVEDFSIESALIASQMLQLEDGVVKAGLSFEEFTKSSFAALAAQLNLQPVMSETHDVVTGFKEGLAGVVDVNEKLEQSMTGIVPIYDEATGKIVGYEQGLINSSNAADSLENKTSKAAKSISDAAREADKAAAAQARWNEVMLQARVDIQTEVIRGNTEIAVAQIEADALKIQAAYESINTTIESTGQLLTDLYGLAYGGDTSLSDQFKIERQIEIENDRRQEALDLQKDLTAAQIKEMEARAKALNRGDGIIQIDGAGLQPHLEGFMWEILRTIQVRVNSDGLDMLLGSPAPI